MARDFSVSGILTQLRSLLVKIISKIFGMLLDILLGDQKVEVDSIRYLEY